jgi:hypothetical protein
VRMGRKLDVAVRLVPSHIGKKNRYGWRVSRPVAAPADGYPQIATFMTQNPELLMVRRFRGLNTISLLYLQAELVYIEKALLKCEKKDAKVKEEDDPRPHYSGDYDWLMKSSDYYSDAESNGD